MLLKIIRLLSFFLLGVFTLDASALEECCLCVPLTDEMEVTTYQLQDNTVKQNGQTLCDWVKAPIKIVGTYPTEPKCDKALAIECR